MDRFKSKLKTCLIHGLGHSYGECKALGDFGAKYAKINPTKDHGNNPIPRKIDSQIENNFIINNVVDGILLNKTQKVSDVREATEFLDSDCNDNNIYQVYEIILEETK